MIQPINKKNSNASDKRTPVTFFDDSKSGFIPGEEIDGEELFFCMADMYQSSQKDYELLRSTNIQYAVTLIIPDARPNYIPTAKHHFIVDDALYDGLKFDIETVAPTRDDEVKIVGVYHAS